MAEAPKTWILTGSPENFDATRGQGVLDEDEWVPAEELGDELEHVRRWPAAHWRLAFQGQLRTVSDADGALLLHHMRAAAATPA